MDLMKVSGAMQTFVTHETNLFLPETPSFFFLYISPLLEKIVIKKSLKCILPSTQPQLYFRTLSFVHIE